MPRLLLPFHALADTRQTDRLPTELRRIGLCKVPRADLALEQNIQLSIRPALRLWQAEECPHEETEAEACPEEARLSPPVPRRRVEHVRCPNIIDHSPEVEETARQYDCLLPETRGWHLGYQ